MGIAAGLGLVALGALMTFAMHRHVGSIDVPTLGVVLVVVGIVVSALAAMLAMSSRDGAVVREGRRDIV